jgi:hypothetical protein
MSQRCAHTSHTHMPLIATVLIHSPRATQRAASSWYWPGQPSCLVEAQHLCLTVVFSSLSWTDRVSVLLPAVRIQLPHRAECCGPTPAQPHQVPADPSVLRSQQPSRGEDTSRLVPRLLTGAAGAVGHPLPRLPLLPPLPPLTSSPPLCPHLLSDQRLWVAEWSHPVIGLPDKGPQPP